MFFHPWEFIRNTKYLNKVYPYLNNGVLMKRVGTQLNEKEYKELKKRVEARGETQYAVIKTLILNFLHEERANEVTLTIAYWFLIYSIIIAVLMLLP